LTTSAEPSPPVALPAKSPRALPVLRVTQHVGPIALRMAKSFGSGESGWWSSGFGGGTAPTVAGAVGDTEEVVDPYKQEPWVAAAVDLRTLVFALARPRLWDRDPDDEDAQEVTEGPLVDLLLKRPARHIDPARLRVHDGQNLMLTGESFWFLRDAKGAPVATYGDGPDAMIELPEDIIPVRGDLVSLECHPVNHLPNVWNVAAGRNTKRSWPAGAVVQHMLTPDPNSTRRPHRGLGPIAKAYGAEVEMYLARRFRGYLLRNAGEPAGFLTTEQYLAQEEAERLQGELSEKLTGQENINDWKLLTGGLKPQSLGRSPREMEDTAFRKASREDISAVFTTPGPLLGLNEANFAVFSGHWQVFMKLAGLPSLGMHQMQVNAFIRRHRDPSLNQLHFRYDTEQLEQLFATPEEAISRTKDYVELGIPLDEALRQGGIKTDPIVGGDVAMVRAGRVSLVSAQLHGAARAAKAAIDARMDPQQAWELAGVPDARLVEPEPEPDPAAKPAEEPAPKDGDEPQKALPAQAASGPARREPDEPGLNRATPALPAAPVHRARTSTQDAEYARTERKLRPHRSKMDRGIKRVFRQMQRAQLAGLEQFAEEGTIDRAAAYAFRGSLVRVADGEELQPLPPTYRRRAPTLSTIERDTLATACLEDWREEAQLERDDPAALEREVGVCSPVRMRVPWRPRQERWLRQRRGLAGATLARLGPLAVMQRITLTDEELDRLILLNDVKWTEALMARIHPITVATFESFAKDVSDAFGVGFVDVVNPAQMQAIRAHAVQVVEGTQTVLAKRMRSDLIRVLSDNATISGEGGLQQAIKESLAELKASTTTAFKDHYARALAIARTETGRAANVAKYAALTAAIEAGSASAVEWITSGQPEEPEGTTRSSHFAMNGVTVVPPNVFVVGPKNSPMKHPHDDSAPAEEVVNCKCTLAGVVEDDDDD